MAHPTHSAMLLFKMLKVIAEQNKDAKNTDERIADCVAACMAAIGLLSLDFGGNPKDAVDVFFRKLREKRREVGHNISWGELMDTFATRTGDSVAISEYEKESEIYVQCGKCGKGTKYLSENLQDARKHTCCGQQAMTNAQFRDVCAQILSVKMSNMMAEMIQNNFGGMEDFQMEEKKAGSREHEVRGIGVNMDTGISINDDMKEMFGAKE